MVKEGNRQTTGAIGEELASKFLTKQGYRIVEKNFRTTLGEVDIIALDRGTITFVEVKTRKNKAFGYPQEAVSLKKQKKLSQVASIYLNKNKLNSEKARFDIVAILLSHDREEQIELIQDAFELCL